MIVVSDASPLIALAAIGELALLEALYGTVIIPEAVFREVAVVSQHAPGAALIRETAWLQTAPVAPSPLLERLFVELDEGEAAAIALAVEIDADLLLMDERRGRAVARQLGVDVIGVAGILLDAKHHGIIPLVRPLLDSLQRRAGFRLSPAVVSQVLEIAGEST